MGKGVDWEGHLITQNLYDERSRNVRFVAVLFDPDCEQYVPEPLRGTTYYTLTSQENYESLRELLDGVAGVEPGPVGDRQPRKRRTARPMVFGDTEARDRTPRPDERDQAGDERGVQAANPFRLSTTDADADDLRVSRSPIVIAVEEEGDPLREDELLQTERHLTVRLSARRSG